MSPINQQQERRSSNKNGRSYRPSRDLKQFSPAQRTYFDRAVVVANSATTTVGESNAIIRNFQMLSSMQCPL